MPPEKLSEEVFSPARAQVLEVPQGGEVHIPLEDTVLATAGEVRERLAVACGGQLLAAVEIGPADMPDQQEHLLIIDRGEDAPIASIEDINDPTVRQHYVRKRYVVIDERALDVLRIAKESGTTSRLVEPTFRQLDPGETMFVGRDPDIDSMGVRDRNPSISRRHASITLDENAGVTVSDLNSLRGTRVHAPKRTVAIQSTFSQPEQN